MGTDVLIVWLLFLLLAEFDTFKLVFTVRTLALSAVFRDEELLTSGDMQFLLSCKLDFL